MDLTQSHRSASPEPHRSLIADAFRLFGQDPLFRAHADYAFERKEVLGSGGMGVVYRVFDRRFRREAALKVLQRAIAAPLVVERFIREARVTALLDHPAIPAVYEFGRSGRGEFYLLMKLIRGQTLKSLIADVHKSGPSAIREPGALADKLRVLIRVCEALDYAHDRGVIHRDLKPDNIMVGRHGDVYIMDWGLARDGRESDDQDADFRRNESEIQSSVFQRSISSQGSVVGTRGYLAPEQAAGEACDGRADLYSIGAMLFEVMAGRRPIEAPGMAGIIAAMEGRLDIPDDFGAGFPPELAALCRRCLSRDPAARPKDANELARALRKVRIGLARGRHAPARRWPAALAIAALSALSLGLAAALALSPRAPAPAIAAEPLPLLDPEPVRHRKRPLSLAARGRLARERGELERAAALLEAGLKDRPQDAAAHHELGLVYLAMGHPKLAQPELDRAASLDRQSAIYAKDRGLAFLRRALDRDAVVELSRAIELDPTLAEAYALRGYCRYLLGERTAALPDFDRAIALDRARPRFYRDRALVYEEAGDAERARADYDRAIALAPEDPQAHVDRGSFFQSAGRYQEAEEDFNRAIALKPTAGVALYFRAQTRRALGRRREALADLDRALELDPRSLEALVERAGLRQELGELRGALADCRAALALGPSDNTASGLNERIAAIEKALAGAKRLREEKVESRKEGDQRS